MRKRELELIYPPTKVKLLLFLKKIGACPHPVETVTTFKWLVKGEYEQGHICEVCLGRVYTLGRKKS